MSITNNQLVSGTLSEIVALLKANGMLRCKCLAVQTGTGSQQTIAHGLGFTPLAINIHLSEATTGAALAYQSAVPDATNIYVLAVSSKTFNVAIFY